MEINKKLTPYSDINDLMILFSERLKEVLGDNLIGVYLTGSLSYGGFIPERSDLDFQVIVKNLLSQKELECVKRVHSDIEKKYKNWSKRIECSYFPVEFLSEILPPKTPRPWYWNGMLYPQVQYGNEWIINKYQLYNHGISLVGPNFNTLIEPVDIEEVQKASIRDLLEQWEPKIEEADWLEDSHQQSFLILNVCRILYTVLQAKVGCNKKVSAEWAKNEFPEWKDLIEEAEGWKYGKEMKRIDDAVVFIKFAIEKVNETGLLG